MTQDNLFFAKCLGASAAVLAVVFLAMFEGVGRHDSVVDYSGRVYELEATKRDVK